MHLCTVQTARAHAIHLHTTSKEQLFSIYRRSVVSSLGLFTARLWTRHNNDRFCDAFVTSTFNAPTFRAGPDREVVFDFHSGDHALVAQIASAHAGIALNTSRMAACFNQYFSILEIVLPLGPAKK
jgi:hypothetical protein